MVDHKTADFQVITLFQYPARRGRRCAATWGRLGLLLAVAALAAPAAALAGGSQQAALPLNFTLGTPFGWRTEKGLSLGQDIHALTALYPAPQMNWTHCIGYSALSQRQGSTVTSIYTQAEVVYGFALTAPSRSVCM